MNLADEITNALAEYTDDVEKSLQRTIRTVGKEAVEKLKVTSPSRTGKYAKSWKLSFSDKSGNAKLRIYNTVYRLTHLLENGHVTGTGGFAKGTPHIGPVNDWAQEEVVKRMEEVLSE